MSKRRDKPPDGAPGGTQNLPKPDISGQPAGGDDDAGEDGLSGRKQKGLAALLSEPTITRAAEAAGIGERTLRRWLTEPGFRAAVNAARRESFGQAIGLTQKYAPVAVATLVKVMQDAAGGPSAKVSAAGMMLKFGREGIELDDLAARVEALEQAAALSLPAPDAKPPEDDE
jgi:hypothetical protein